MTTQSVPRPVAVAARFAVYAIPFVLLRSPVVEADGQTIGAFWSVLAFLLALALSLAPGPFNELYKNSSVVRNGTSAVAGFLVIYAILAGSLDASAELRTLLAVSAGALAAGAVEFYERDAPSNTTT